MMPPTTRRSRRAQLFALCAAVAACSGSDDPAPPASTAPTAAIASPAAGATFRAGDTLSFAGSGSDAKDGALAPGQLTWWADLHHDSHAHPFVQPTTGASGSVAVPVRGETSDNIFYRFHLRATDSTGAATEVTRDVLPQKSQLTLATQPAGLRLTLDGQPVTAPHAFTGVVGIERDLGAPGQSLNCRNYQFSTWNPGGGSATRTISTPAANTTYTATFVDSGPASNAPAVALIAPANNSSGTVGTPITLTATASDSDGSIANVVFLDGATAIGSADASAPYSVSWTPSAAGTHTLTARATDSCGSAATSAAVTVTINAATGDTQPPTVAFTAPASLADGLTGSLQITATATDNVGVASVEFQVDGVTVVTDTASPYAASVDTTQYASGQHVIRVRASDGAGNTSSWLSRTVRFGGSRATASGFTRNESFVTGLSSATAFAQLPDGRLLIAQQGGTLLVRQSSGAEIGTMLTLSVDSQGERGLLGVTPHPTFASNGFIYVYYTTTSGGTHNRISRFTVSGDTASGEVHIANLPALSGATNHNGGALHFGTDGKLYVAVGDNANSSKAPMLNDPFGKMLRFNDDGSIPNDNPFCTTQGDITCAIWARGLRNPFTFAVRASDGRIHVNDVGEGTWEEINLGVAGVNYGWPATEGPTNANGVTGPLFAFDHNSAADNTAGFFSGCAIIGGAFYPDSGPFPQAYRGGYYFTDLCTPVIGRIDLASGSAAYAFGSVSGSPVGMMVANDGALLVLRQSGITRFTAP
jgi:glucose/arabinose dehydrogenase